jgi:hypothetical protein
MFAEMEVPMRFRNGCRLSALLILGTAAFLGCGQSLDGTQKVTGSVSCGGLAGAACPGVGKCVDDPTDSCDPTTGADCPGICSCVQNVACVSGDQFDSSPSVCACVPGKPTSCGAVCDIYCQYGNVVDANGCPTCACNPPPTDPCATVMCATGTHCDSGKCLSDGVSCGGFVNTPCPGLGSCVDDPYDTCSGGDCPGICSCVQNVACASGSQFDGSPSVCACVPYMDPCANVKCASGTHCDSGKCLSDGVLCGGLAGIPCAGLGTCVDNPYDGCDPAMGGADCPGICSCVQNVACTANNVFDSSPSVCACVPAPTGVCPPEKCPTPVPEAPTVMCADGTTAGPTCVLNSSGACGWTITTCPAQ